MTSEYDARNPSPGIYINYNNAYSTYPGCLKNANQTNRTNRTSMKCFGIKKRQSIWVGLRKTVIENIQEKKTEEEIKNMKAPLIKKLEMAELNKVNIKNQKFLSFNYKALSTEKFKRNYNFISKRLRRIEALFGAGYHLYFKYMLNFLYQSFGIFIMSLALLIIPHYLSNSGILNYTDITRKDCMVQNSSNISGLSVSEIKTSIVNFKGLLYGTYTINLIEGHYDFKLAYGSDLVISLILIALFLIYRSCQISSRTLVIDDSYFCTQKLFCGYSFSIFDESEAITSQIKNSKELDAFSQHVEKLKKSKAMGIKVFIYRGLITMYTLIFCGLTCYAIIRMGTFVKNHETSSKYYSFLILLPSALLSVLKIIFEITIYHLIKLEMYNATMELVIYVMRLVLFTLISLSFYIKDDLEGNNTLNCWESFLGLDLQLFVIVGFVFEILNHIVAIIWEKLSKSFSANKLEYDVPSLLIVIFADQTIFWMGFFYSPWISLMVALKLLIKISYTPYLLKHYYLVSPSYYDHYILKYLCDKCLWIFYFYYLVVFGYSISTVKSSRCGPYGIISCGEESYILDKVVSSMLIQIIKDNSIIRYINSISFSILLIILICVITSDVFNKWLYHRKYVKLNNTQFKCLIEENKRLNEEISKI